MHQRIDRRSVLRGMAGAAIGLPLLDAMEPLRSSAHAQPAQAPRRFVVWFQPGGAVREQWLPHGGESDFVLHDTLAPLEPFRDQLLILDGLDIKVAATGVGNPHFRGLAAFLAGSYLAEGNFAGQDGAVVPSTGWAQGVSLDQVIARHIGGTTKFPSVELGVRHDGPRGAHPNRSMSYDGPDAPRQPIVDPVQAWQELFSDVTTDVATLNAERAHKKSILDGVKQEYSAILPRVSADDRSKLQSHFDRIREVEKALDGLVLGGNGCAPGAGPPVIAYSSDNFELLGKAMMRTLVMALTCDVTRVISLQWIDPLARNLLPFLGFQDNHHCVQHNCSYQPDKLLKIERWYAEQFADLLGMLSETEELGAPLLDSLVIYHGSEISDAPVHGLSNVPYMLAGKLGGTFRTGRFLRYPQRSNIDLLIALQNAFGIASDSFGEPGFSGGALPGLT
jgi:hypothetical protein